MIEARTNDRQTARRGRTSLVRTPRSLHPLLVVAFAVSLLVAGCLGQPTFINQMTVENPTPYDIHIAASSDDRQAEVDVGTARRRSTSTFDQILDQGDVWIFHFDAQGEDAGQLRLTRSELERAGWRFTIPEAVNEKLQEQGAPFPP